MVWGLRRRVLGSYGGAIKSSERQRSSFLKLNPRKGSNVQTGAKRRPPRRAASRLSSRRGNPGLEQSPSVIRRIFVGFFGMLVLPLVLLAGLATGIGYFRLQQGPVSVNFLGEPIRQGIDQGLFGFSASFEDVILTLSETGGLELRLKGLKLEESGGETVVSAPQAAIGLSAASIWQMKAAPDRVELIEPRISLTYSRQAGLSLDFAGEPGQFGAGAASVAITPTDLESDVFDLGSVVATAARYSRQSGGNSSLREVGLRNAMVVLDAEGRKSTWQVPRLLIDVDRRSNSNIVSGSARISSAGRIWTASVRMEDMGEGKEVSVLASLRDVVPSQIAAAVPGADFLGALSAPMSADIKAQVSAAGELIGSHFAVEVTGTQLLPQGFDAPLMTVDGGVLNFSYDTGSDRVILRPSRVRLGDANLELSGVFSDTGNGGGSQTDWGFEVQARPTALEDASVQAETVAVRGGILRGRLSPEGHRIVLDEASLNLTGGSVRFTGDIDTSPEPGSRLEGSFSGIPVRQLAALWPRGLAPGGRGWVRDNVRGGEVKAGSFSYLSGKYLDAAPAQTGSGTAHLVVAMEAGNLAFAPLNGLPAMTAAQANGRFENDVVEITLPEAVMDVGERQIKLSQLRFTGSDMLGEAASGQLGFDFEGEASGFVELFQSPALVDALGDNQFPSGLTGKVAGKAVIGFALDGEIAVEDVGYEIEARLSEGQFSGILDGEDIKGASLDIQASPQALEINGEVLIKGVLAKVNWQRITDDEEGRQPPARVTATLDNSDRKQLGIELDEFVTGDVPVVVTVEQPGMAEQSVHVRADLTAATLSLDVVGWKKPAGREAFLDFDVIDIPSGGKMLSNLRIAKSDIAIEGEVELDRQSKVIGFDFPNFSLDLVSRLSVSGKSGDGGIWKINVNGKTYVGRRYFRSLFTVADAPAARTAGADEGYDVSGKIDTVQGFEDVSLRGLKFDMSLRGGNLTALEGRGELSGGRPLAFDLSHERGRRLIRVDTSDAGQALKLAGVYPNMEGGRLRLEVDLEGSGAAEETGTLWVERFKILGDPIVSEVIGSGDEGVPAIARKQHVVRQVIDFDTLRAPFSVGHGQLVIQDAAMKGPLIGATLRGKADFNEKVVDLGGTYVFLQGLNNMLAPIPVLGEILSGPRKEGVFGTNFAIRGSMASPQVFVHPLSVLAPGIFREIFQFEPGSQSVSPRDDNAGTGGSSTRSSSSPAIGVPVAPGHSIEGWNSQTSPN